MRKTAKRATKTPKPKVVKIEEEIEEIDVAEGDIRRNYDPFQTVPPPGAALWTALAKAQADLPTITFDKKNPHFGSKYCSLAHMIGLCQPVLEEHGLFIAQPIKAITNAAGDLAGMLVSTLIVHPESGLQFTSSYPVALDANPQKMAGAVTYARRISYAAALGFVAEEDDDGNAASAPSRPKAATTAPIEKKELPDVTPKMSAEFANNIIDQMTLAKKPTDVDDIAKKYRDDYGKCNEEDQKRIVAAASAVRATLVEEMKRAAREEVSEEAF